MPQTRFDEALTDVSKIFKRPEDILGAADLSEAQKIALLKQWDTDLRLLMVASEENMTGTAAPGRTAELLQSVHKAMTRLGHGLTEENRSPSKAGG
ncbi:MAG TPA: hypothetical protein VGH25_07770 [Dongiaceae bacterium]